MTTRKIALVPTVPRPMPPLVAGWDSKSPMDAPVYGVDKLSGMKTTPYLETSVDVMAVGNLPNELPRDASRYFGEQMIKYVLDDIRKGGSAAIERATILKDGQLTASFQYLADYAAH